MNVLIIGGFNMHLDTQPSVEAYWAMSDVLEAAGMAVRLRECDENLSANGVAPVDILWADVVICYSYGMASYKNLVHNLAIPPAKCAMVIVIAGVPDFWKNQFYGNIWHLSDFVQRGRCFQVDAIPASADLKNDGVVNVKFGDPIPPESRWVNIDCNTLVAELPLVERHTHIQDHTQLVAAVVELVKGQIPSTSESNQVLATPP